MIYIYTYKKLGGVALLDLDLFILRRGGDLERDLDLDLECDRDLDLRPLRPGGDLDLERDLELR